VFAITAVVQQKPPSLADFCLFRGSVCDPTQGRTLLHCVRPLYEAKFWLGLAIEHFSGRAMDFTDEDAAVMYAKACHAWYGRNAARVVKKKIKQLEQANDGSGVRIWSRVGEHVSRLQKEGAPTARRRHFVD
jgi:hypothetical protein